MRPRDILFFRWRHIVLSVALTGVALVISHLLDQAGVATTLAPALPAIVTAGVIGGLVPALVSAIMVGAYSHMFFPESLPRAMVVNVSYLLAALLIGYIQAKVRLFDNLNGNLDRLRSAVAAEDDNIAYVDGMLNKWDVTSDDGRLRDLRVLRQRMGNNRHHLAHLATLVFGWRDIRKEMDTTEGMAEQKHGYSDRDD